MDTINSFSSSVTVKKKKKNDAEDTEPKTFNNAFLIRQHQLEASADCHWHNKHNNEAV